MGTEIPYSGIRIAKGSAVEARIESAKADFVPLWQCKVRQETARQR